MPLLFAVALLLLACSQPPNDPIVLNGSTMGTYWTVRLGTVPSDVSVAALRGDIEALLEQVNDEMSTWRPDAWISRYNQAEAGTEFIIPEGFARVLAAALDLAEDTGGAYDPTVGPLVNLWGFGPESRPEALPDADSLAAARERVGWWRVDFDPVSRRLIQPGDVYLDLSSIAKGFGVDIVAELLQSRGFSGYLVDIGGDIRTRGARPDGQPWRIAIERPVPGQREIQQIIEPGDAAVVTSGTYRQFFEIDGERYSHTIDPRDGWPVRHAIVSVTVIAPTATEADGLATALGVFEPEQALAFAVERGIAVLWILDRPDGLEALHTPAFAPFLPEQD